MNTVTLGTATYEVRLVWECACSGDGHPVGEPNAKCFRKGGDWREDLFDLTTDGWVGSRFNDLQQKRYFVKTYGWRDMGDGWMLRPLAKAAQ